MAEDSRIPANSNNRKSIPTYTLYTLDVYKSARYYFSTALENLKAQIVTSGWGGIQHSVIDALQ